MHGGSGNDGGYADRSIYFSLFFFFSPLKGTNKFPILCMI